MNTYSRTRTAAILSTIVALAVAVIVGTSSCKTTDTPQPQDPGSIVADITTCASAPVHDLATHALDDFASALVSANYVGGITYIVAGIIKATYDTLKGRAEVYAWQAAKCAIQELKEQAAVHLGHGHMDAATAQRETLLNRNASQWLLEHQ